MAKSNQIKVKQHTAESLQTAMPVTSITNPVSGLTIVFARIGARMVGVSLAWCAPEDKFKRKKGVVTACENVYFADSFQFQVPMLGASNEQIVYALTNMFCGVDFSTCEFQPAGFYYQNN